MIVKKLSEFVPGEVGMLVTGVEGRDCDGDELSIGTGNIVQVDSQSPDSKETLVRLLDYEAQGFAPADRPIPVPDDLCAIT